MQIDNESTRTLILLFGSVVLPITTAIYTWIATRDKDNSRHIKAVEKVLNDNVARLTSRADQAEAALKHLASAEEIAELKGDLRALEATQEAALREAKDTRLAVNRIEDYLLRK
ncbi:TPA: hypothetical protein QDC44_001669 [Burkholderia cepacia ATCC 25416]|uniref:hypothetical protein n=1 Tax=Burkholderia cepacia TaxID=292 RepID=UPI001CF59C11|nr:hypothetical protein [Burkholderia cepacia]MCA8356075.1 hypothetical protein [Burkholderia cepacia]HDR9757558.1 hypothetical protein [Burkholderia cepacia ATCC 25416]